MICSYAQGLSCTAGNDSFSLNSWVSTVRQNSHCAGQWAQTTPHSKCKAQDRMLLCIQLVFAQIYPSKQEKSWGLCFWPLRQCLAGNGCQAHSSQYVPLFHNVLLRESNTISLSSANVTFNLYILLAHHLVPSVWVLYIKALKLKHNKEVVLAVPTCSRSTLSVLWTYVSASSSCTTSECVRRRSVGSD